MRTEEGPPLYDSEGYNVFDPNDTLSYKTDYITLLQDKALRHHLPQGDGGVALDLGCGWGRVSRSVSERGWKVIGVDPDETQIDYAKRNAPDIDFRVGKLPELPVDRDSVDLMLMQNLLRVIHMMGQLDSVPGFSQFLAPHASVIVVDNIWRGHDTFLDESWLMETFEKEGLELVSRVPIRAGRWWLLYMIRYGLIPRSRFDAIANYELKLRARQPKLSWWRYFNVLFHFRRTS